MSSLVFLLLMPTVTMSASGDRAGHAHKNGHGQVEVSSFTAIPSLSLEVSRDAFAGWNIHLVIKNFRFTPEHVNENPIAGEGHAHLHVDGKKIARMYGAWFHLGNLSPGPHSIRVTLNANNHAELVLHGKPIAVSKEIVQ